MTLLLDDQLLSAYLRGTWSPPGGEPVCTTGCWYVRLCTALARHGAGALSGAFEALPGGLRDRAVRAVLSLPAEVGLLSLRELGPLMGELAGRHQLNLLAREALAAAITFPATVLMAEHNENGALAAAVAAEGGAAHLVGLGEGAGGRA